MKKLSIFLVLLCLALCVYAGGDIIPVKVTNHYFQRKNGLNKNSIDVNKLNSQGIYKGALDCNVTVIQGQEYTGWIGAPLVLFQPTTVYTSSGTLNPSTMGIGYLVSLGEGTGLSNGGLTWTNKIGFNISVNTGFKPTSLTSMPADIALGVYWHGLAAGIFDDVINHKFGVYGGIAIVPTFNTGGSIFSLHCLK
jgi:hypothetical protein